jgi:hypothetical protein
MVTRCVNPTCDTPFRYLRGGRLFLVDCPSVPNTNSHHPAPKTVRASEFFWLCEECSQSMSIIVDKSGSVVLLAGDKPLQVLRDYVTRFEDDFCSVSAKAGTA